MKNLTSVTSQEKAEVVEASPDYFGLAYVKKEGAPADPRLYTWECNCDACKLRYENSLKAFLNYINDNSSSKS